MVTVIRILKTTTSHQLESGDSGIGILKIAIQWSKSHQGSGSRIRIKDQGSRIKDQESRIKDQDHQEINLLKAGGVDEINCCAIGLEGIKQNIFEESDHQLESGDSTGTNTGGPIEIGSSKVES